MTDKQEKQFKKASKKADKKLTDRRLKRFHQRRRLIKKLAAFYVKVAIDVENATTLKDTLRSASLAQVEKDATAFNHDLSQAVRDKVDRQLSHKRHQK